MALPDTTREVILGEVIQRNKFPSMRWENFDECLRLWMVWEQKSILPYAGGYWDMPADIVQMFDIFDAAFNAWKKSKEK